MAGSCSTGHSLGPIFLRLALGITFLWAGFGKVIQTMPVKGESAAILANMGVISPTSPAAPSAPDTTLPKPPVPGDVTKPEEPTKPTDEVKPPKPLLRLAQQPVKEVAPDAKPVAATPATSSLATAFTAAEFPEETSVRAVYGIALMLHAAANPAPQADGAATMPLIPPKLAQDRLPVYLAWAAAVTELLCGLFVLVGILTRLSAFALAVTMGTAIWLTQIGPAIQAHDTMLGFLPNHPAYATNSAGNPVHAMLMWQFCLLCSCLALVFMGAGAFSFDRALLPPLGRREAPAAD